LNERATAEAKASSGTAGVAGDAGEACEAAENAAKSALFVEKDIRTSLYVVALIAVPPYTESQQGSFERRPP
jgi:hypothetical protein